jgi:hypothetical protein
LGLSEDFATTPIRTLNHAVDQRLFRLRI